eukprot:m51a1_g7880 hypothetical protein (870) ;mRNA; f:40748-46314
MFTPSSGTSGVDDGQPRPRISMDTPPPSVQSSDGSPRAEQVRALTKQPSFVGALPLHAVLDLDADAGEPSAPPPASLAAISFTAPAFPLHPLHPAGTEAPAEPLAEATEQQEQQEQEQQQAYSAPDDYAGSYDDEVPPPQTAPETAQDEPQATPGSAAGGRTGAEAGEDESEGPEGAVGAQDTPSQAAGETEQDRTPRESAESSPLATARAPITSCSADDVPPPTSTPPPEQPLQPLQQYGGYVAPPPGPAPPAPSQPSQLPPIDVEELEDLTSAKTPDPSDALAPPAVSSLELREPSVAAAAARAEDLSASSPSSGSHLSPAVLPMSPGQLRGAGAPGATARAASGSSAAAGPKLSPAQLQQIQMLQEQQAMLQQALQQQHAMQQQALQMQQAALQQQLGMQYQLPKMYAMAAAPAQTSPAAAQMGAPYQIPAGAVLGAAPPGSPAAMAACPPGVGAMMPGIARSTSSNAMMGAPGMQQQQQQQQGMQAMQGLARSTSSSAVMGPGMQPSMQMGMQMQAAMQQQQQGMQAMQQQQAMQAMQQQQQQQQAMQMQMQAAMQQQGMQGGMPVGVQVQPGVQPGMQTGVQPQTGQTAPPAMAALSGGGPPSGKGEPSPLKQSAGGFSDPIAEGGVVDEEGKGAEDYTPGAKRQVSSKKSCGDPFFFFIREGRLEQYKLPRDKKVIKIGRHADVDLQLTKRDQSVSRFHAQVTATSAGGGVVKYIYKDTSSYGSFLCNQRVTERELVDGDKFYLGTCEDMVLFIRPPSCCAPEFEGLVYKKSNAFHKQWQARWMCLWRETLFYFKHKDDPAPVGCIDLNGVLLTETQKPKNSFAIITRGKTYHFYLKTEQDKAAWMNAIDCSVPRAKAQQTPH